MCLVDSGTRWDDEANLSEDIKNLMQDRKLNRFEHVDTIPDSYIEFLYERVAKALGVTVEQLKEDYRGSSS